MISAFGLLLFGGSIVVKHQEQLVVVDEWLKVRDLSVGCDLLTSHFPAQSPCPCGSAVQAAARSGGCESGRTSSAADGDKRVQFDDLLLAKIEQPNCDISKSKVVQAVVAVLKAG